MVKDEHLGPVMMMKKVEIHLWVALLAAAVLLVVAADTAGTAVPARVLAPLTVALVAATTRLAGTTKRVARGPVLLAAVPLAASTNGYPLRLPLILCE